jgi:citronellol/citronellal dehydrogenase
MIAGMADNDARSAVFAEGLLSGKVALVTGGGTGLGKATAIELARCGASVTIAGRRAETLEAATREILREIGADAGETATGGGEMATGGGEMATRVAEMATRVAETATRGGEMATGGGGGGAEDTKADAGTDGSDGPGLVDWMAGDVREPGDARGLIETVIERHGRLDILINNAGGQYFTPAEGIVPKGWRAVWRLNVEGMLNMSEAAVEQGMGGGGSPARGSESAAEATEDGARAGGVIVNVTLSPHHGMPGMAHSGAARATVEALTREMAERWSDRKVAVTAIAAGHFDTEAMGKYPETVRAGMGRSVPLQRLGAPQEHAWLVALLCSPLGGALNGSTITLDGARDNWFGPWPPPGLTGETGEVPTEERRGLKSA